MRHLDTESHFRHALFALQDADGYVDALLEMARSHAVGSGSAVSFRHAQTRLRAERAKGATQSRTGSPN